MTVLVNVVVPLLYCFIALLGDSSQADPAQVTSFNVSSNSIIQNETLLLNCTASGDPPPTLMLLHEETGRVLNSTPSGYSIQAMVPDCQCEDYGTYICAGYNDLNEGNSTENQPVEVLCAPKPDDRSNNMTYSYSTYMGSEIYMNMVALGDPIPSFNWTHAGKEVPVAMVTTINETSFLHISNVSIADLGWYVLTMNNEYGSYSATYLLKGREVPGEATNVKITSIGAESFSMKWTSGFDYGYKQKFYVMLEISDAKGYIEFAQFNDTSEHPGIDNVSHVINYMYLDRDTEYTFAILSLNAIGNSNLSEPVTFRTSASKAPEDATHVKVANITETSVLMTWTTGYDFGSKQRFYVMIEDPVFHVYIPFVEFNDTSEHPGIANVSHVIGGLVSDREYSFTVQASNLFGFSNLSEPVTFRTLPDKVPEDVTNVKVANITETSVLMTWTSGYDFGYRQRFYVMKVDPEIHMYTPFVEFNDTSEHPGIDNVSHVIGGLDGNTEYSFTVIAVNLYGYSNLSAPVIFRTLSDNDKDASTLNGATIAGAVVGAVVFLVLIGGIVYLAKTRMCNRVSNYDQL